MADSFRDPRIEGSLNALNARLEEIAANVEEGERRAAERDRLRKPGRTPARPGGEPTLDDEFRSQEAARKRADDEERAARARKDRARAADQEAKADRFIAEKSGQRSGAVRDVQTGEVVRRFRGGGDQQVALRAAKDYADTLNRAKRAVDGIGKELIRHPQLFGRQVYAPVSRSPGQPDRPGRPPGGVGAAEQRLFAADAELNNAKKAYTNAVKRNAAQEGAQAKQRITVAQQEVAAAKANVSAAKQEAIAREAHAAQLKALAGQEAAASRAQVRRTVDYSRFLQGQQRLFQSGQLRQLVDQAGAGRGQYDAMRQRYPGPPRPTTGFGLPGGDEARAAAGGTLRGTGVGAADEIQKTGAAATTASRGVQSYGQSIAFSAREQDLAANAARRNGALTTEFIEAAARGRTTIRELGYQVGATIGKFAGWTAAATAVFGAAAAIRELGVGAIDTAEGVNNLTRIIPQLDREAAAQGIQDLSQRFNLPVGDVADAAYGISKTFGSIKDPAEALKQTLGATEAVLFAMKVGELDVASATRYLTSIIQGFKLTAEDMPLLLDTINQAQNKFGGNVGQITQGVAQAAGAFKSAGGSYRELIALIQTGSRVTGRTGAEIGTALRRSADIYQRPERRQTILDLIGIDPRESTVVEVIEAAMRAVRGAAPALQSQIAKSISTPELSSGRILPILRSGALYRQISAGISPGESQGSAQRELDRALRGPREQISRLRTDLQLLGSELATAGFLAPFEALVKVLDRAFDLLTGIAELVGDLPGPLRLAAAYALPLGAALGAARRFDVGNGRGPLGRSRGATARADIVTGLDAERQAIGGERVARATELRSASLKVQRVDRELATLVGDEEETVQRRSALSDRRAGLVRQIGDVEDDLTGLHQQEATVMRQRRAVIGTRLRNERTVLAVAQAEGIAYRQPGRLSRPFPGGPIPLRGDPFIDPSRGPQAPAPRPPGAYIAPGLGFGSGQGPQAPAQIAAQQAKLARYGERFNAAMRPLGTSGRALGAVGAKAGRAGSTAAAGLANAARGASTGAAGLAAAIGPLDLIIAALLAYVALEQLLGQKTDEVAEASKGMDKAIGPEGLASKIRESQSTLDSSGTKIADGYAEVKNVLKGLQEALPLQTGAGLDDLFKNPFEEGRGVNRILEGVETPGEKLQKDQDRNRVRLRQLRRAQDRDRLLYQDAIRKRARAEFEAADGPDADAERQEAIEKARKLYQDSLYKHSGRLQKRPQARAEAAVTRDLIAQLRGEAAATASNVNAFRENLEGVDDAASAEALVRNLQVRISRRGVRPTLGRASEALQHLRQLAQDRTGEERTKIIEQLTTLQDDVLGRIETQFQRSLQGGASPQRARRRYLNAAAVALFGVRTLAELRELQNRRRRLRALIRAVESVLDRLEGQAGRALSEIAGDALGQRTGRQNQRLSRLNRLLRALGPGPSRDDLDSYRQIQQESQDAVDQILEEGRQDAESKLQEAISIFQSRQRNASARSLIGASQGARLQRALSDAQAFVGFLQSQKGVDQATLLDAQTAVFEAQDAYAQYLEEQAQALVRARSAFAQSRTTDPVKQALIRLREAQQLLRFAETPAERLEGLAEINNRRRELEQSRQQERVDQEQFLFDLGKITQEQYAAWIRRFLRAHKTLRKTNRELFRQLRRQLHQLNQETDAEGDLQVGDIRLPTLYDVRRLILAGTRANSPTVVQQTNSYQVNGVTDPEAVASAIGGHQRNAGKSALRAAGLT